MTEGRNRIEINVGCTPTAMNFSTNGKCLLTGGLGGVQVWQVEDKKRMATMRTDGLNVYSLAVSRDGRYIAAGTTGGYMHVWDAKTYEKVFVQRVFCVGAVDSVDFSPDSTRLVSIWNGTATTWDIATRRRLQTFPKPTIAIRYSPQGDRIATAGFRSVRIYDSNDSRLLAEENVNIFPLRNTSLLWTNDHLFALSNGKIAQIEPATGSLVSEWAVPDTTLQARIAIPKHEGFVAYSTRHTVSFWDIATHARLGVINHHGAIRSIAFSPDNHFIAIGGDPAKVTIESLSRIIASTPQQSSALACRDDNLSSNTPEDPGELESEPFISESVSSSHPCPTFHSPSFHIDDTALDLWKQDRLADVESLLATAINASQKTDHHLLASRALIRTRLREWDAALIDAEMAIQIRPCAIAYIAKSIALVGKGQRYDGYRACDIAFAPFHSPYVAFFLLIKAIIVFMAGEHLDAISRIDDLIATVSPNPIYHVVQAYMYLLLGNLRMESSNYENAIESFERARARMRHNPSQTFLLISLISGWKFGDLTATVRRRLSDALYASGRTEDAVRCFHDMTSEFAIETKLHDDHLEWAQKFKQHACKKLEDLGDVAAHGEQHDEAISYYTTVLSLYPSSPQGILIKRGNAYMASGCWKQALDDANQVIILDPLSPWGYEIKHSVLHKTGDYDSAIEAFETMLSKMEQSPDPNIRQRRTQYKTPSKTRTRIRRIVQRTLRDSPHVLINTTTGMLSNRAERAFTFESLPVFKELLSSMTTRIDRARIKHEVRRFFQYVMLSHRWEENEPLFKHVVHVTVYDLEPSERRGSIGHGAILVASIQESTTSIRRRWWQCSNGTLMIVFLRGVGYASQLGALAGSIWNTRGWTLQEYIAAKVIHFYTEDWTPYLNLELMNHKESPEVIAEMEQATGVPSDQLIALRPGLTSIREKLRLASTRQTERVEDAAYSLLGILSVSGIPAIYGEGDAALGRLLSHVLAGSGDVSILAWTGESGSFNSCLPARISVFNGPPTSHLPSPIPDDEMERIITTSYTSSFDLDVAPRLYQCLKDLPPPWFAASRMKLPCIAFQLPQLSPRRTRSGRVYRADTISFGMVEIKTRQDLSRMEFLYLVHPWLDSLLEQVHVQSGASVGHDVMPPSSLSSDDEYISNDEFDEEFDGSSSENPEPGPQSHPAPGPVHAVPVNRETRARRLAARLRQPFGALLFTSVETGRRALDYRRVAADCLITVAFQDYVSLDDILDNVRTLDVL